MAVRYTMGAKKPAHKPVHTAIVLSTAPTLGTGAAKKPPTPAYTAPAAPSAAPAPPPGAQAPGLLAPPDPVLEQQRAALARQRENTVTQLGAQRQTGLLQYGYREDPGTGAISFDTANPNSQAALLKRSYDNAHRGNTTSMAASGHLYAGSLQNAQDETTRQQGVGEDSLQKAVAAFLAKNSAGVAQAGTDYELGAAGAGADSLARAPDNPLYSPIDTAPATAAVAAAAATARKAPAVKPAATPKKKMVKKKATLVMSKKKAVSVRGF